MDYSIDTETVLSLEGAVNFRELGGIPCSGGRRVKPGLIYRAGELSALTASDKAELERRGIKTIVDFRQEEEQKFAPDSKWPGVKKRVSMPLELGSLPSLFAKGEDVDGKALMITLYRLLVSEGLPYFRSFFEILADVENAPLVFHCTAGKDRTGVCSALVLSALGADRETAIADYLLSEPCLGTKFDDIIAAAPFRKALLTVDRLYIEAAFDEIDANLGGMDRYLRSSLAAPIEQLREMYTEASWKR